LFFLLGSLLQSWDMLAASAQFRVLGHQGKHLSGSVSKWNYLSYALLFGELIPKATTLLPEFAFQLDKHATYSRSAEEIEKAKILSLVRAIEFVEAITSCTGLLNQFSDPRLTLYYVAREKEDVDERLQYGLEHCHEFWSAKDPINLRLSECKWLSLQHSQLPCHPSCTEQEQIRPLHPSPVCVS